MAKRKFARNPADVRAGIDASKIGMSSAAQRTATSAEIKTYQKTGKSPAMERALQATQAQAKAPLPQPTVPTNISAYTQAPAPTPGQLPLVPADNPFGVVPFTPAQSEQAPAPGQQFGIPEGAGFAPPDASAFEKVTAALKFIPGGGFVSKAGAVGGKAAIKSLESLITKSTKDVAKAAAGKLPKTSGVKAGNIAKNTVTARKTTSWISKLVPKTALGKGVAATIVGAIGTYPFAGFIKEEALQTLSLGVNTALRNKDTEGAEEAIDHQAEILNPSTWEQIISAVPYANVVKELIDFYNAAQTKLDIDAKAVERLRTQIHEEGIDIPSEFTQERLATEEAVREQELEHREEDKAFWDEIQIEKNEQEEANRKYWEEFKERQRQLDAEAAAAQREEVGQFWKRYREEQSKLSFEDWLKKRKSNLKFGLLG